MTLKGFVKGIAIFDAIKAVLSTAIVVGLCIIAMTPDDTPEEKELLKILILITIFGGFISLMLSWLLYYAAKNSKRTLISIWTTLQFLVVFIGTYQLIKGLVETGLSLDTLFETAFVILEVFFLVKVNQFKKELDTVTICVPELVPTDVERGVNIKL